MCISTCGISELHWENGYFRTIGKITRNRVFPESGKFTLLCVYPHVELPWENGYFRTLGKFTGNRVFPESGKFTCLCAYPHVEIHPDERRPT